VEEVSVCVTSSFEDGDGQGGDVGGRRRGSGRDVGVFVEGICF
jgi:hypothetical protein